MIDPLSILGLVSFTIIVGSLGYALHERTGIPDVVWLLVLGFVIGPLLGLYPHDLFMAIAPLLGYAAIGMILFEAGLNIDIYKFIREVPRSSTLAFTSFTLSLLLGGLYVYYVSRIGLEWLSEPFSLTESLLVASMAAGVSVVSLSDILCRIESSGIELSELKDLLIAESVLMEPVCIIASITIVNFMIHKGVSPAVEAKGFLTAISTGFLIGFIAGLAWLFLLNRIKELKYDYLLTVAALFAAYIGAEALGGLGAGAMAALVFGLVLGNSTSISRMLNLQRPLVIDKSRLIEFHSEMAFLIRSFFFVLLGLTVYVSLGTVALSLGLLLMLQAARWLTGLLMGKALRLGDVEVSVLRNISPRGLATAVVSFLPTIYGLPKAEAYPTIAFVLILGTIVWSSASATLIVRRTRVGEAEEGEAERAEEPAQEEQPQPGLAQEQYSS